MNHDPMPTAEELDALLDRYDPIEPSRLSTNGIEKALDDLGAAITGTSLRVAQTTGRRSRRRRHIVIIAAAVVLATATVAAATGLTAHTGTFNPTPEQIANAGPEAAATM